MAAGVTYFQTGTGHLLVGLVSLWSLRKYYAGPVSILYGPTAEGPLNLWEKDPTLNVTLTPMPVPDHRRHAHNVAKTWMHRHTPFNPTIFLDADTVVTGSIDELWPNDLGHVVWTQFSNWKFLRSPYERRAEGFVAKCMKMRTTAQASLLNAVRDNPAAINTGVFAYFKDAPVLERIAIWAEDGWRAFICDEMAAQLLYPEYGYRLLDDRFNHSPKYGTCRNNPAAVMVHHNHGSRQFRYPQSRALWLGLFSECWHHNIGSVQQWISPKDRVEVVGGWLGIKT